jgi:hypothetical protein
MTPNLRQVPTFAAPDRREIQCIFVIDDCA